MAQMQAYRFETTGDVTQVLRLQTIPKPTPTEGESLVRVVAATIYPSDCKNVAGSFPQTTLPRTPGRSFAGVIEGGKYDGLKVWGVSGEHGFVKDGTHAQYVVIPDGGICEKPKTLSFAEAAACSISFVTAQVMLHRAAVKGGDTVLVIGSSGGVGSAAVQVAKSFQATVVPTARAERAGYVNTSLDDYVAQTKTITSGKGIDVVLDTVSDPAIFKKALVTLNGGGKYVIITAPRSNDHLLSFDALSLYRADRSMLGVNTLNVSFEEASKLLGGLKSAFDSQLLEPPHNIVEVDFMNEAEGIGAYEKVTRGEKGKFVLMLDRK